jgi:hypothetical protein
MTWKSFEDSTDRLNRMGYAEVSRTIGMMTAEGLMPSLLVFALSHNGLKQKKL